MRSRTGVIAAVVVLTAGAGLATLFYRQAPPPEPTARWEPIRHRADDGPRFLMEVRSSPPPLSPPPPPVEPPPRAEPMERISGLPLFEADRAAVPRIAERYPDTADRAPQPEARPTQHRIIDGDTLEQIAQLYLGDADRANEILEANREVLDDPQVLPIGVLLEIPGR